MNVLKKVSSLLRPEWRALLGAEMDKPYFVELCRFLETELTEQVVYPPLNDVFAALNATPPDDVKLVIVGQDPYHGAGQAHGLSFSVRPSIAPPPSLNNIFKEIMSDIGSTQLLNGDLTPWAEQGVLLLNRVLTVRAGAAGSHQKQGWERFTEAVLRALAARNSPLVCLLWGSHAQQVAPIFSGAAHCVLMAPHPSPLSSYRGFFGCRHFSLANAHLTAHKLAPIVW